MVEFDELLHELAMVDEQLQDLPTDAIPERVDLHDRQHELRAQLHALVPDYDATRKTGQLEAELAAMEVQLSCIEDQEINVAEQGPNGTSTQQILTDAGDIDRRIEEGHGVPALRDRIVHIRGILDERVAP